MPFLILFSISWLAFGLFADKPRWREFLPASLLAMIMSLTSDVLMYSYPLWVYQDGTRMLTTVQVHLLDDWGIYPVTAFLFVQYFPETKGLKQKWLYFFAWTTGVILLEALFCTMGWMKHQMWWNLFLSYLADWLILFALLRFNIRFRKKEESPLDQAPSAPESGAENAVFVHPNTSESKALIDWMRSFGNELYGLLHHTDVRVYLSEIPPGGMVPDHIHDGEEYILVLEGELEVAVDTSVYLIKPGMLLDLPRQIHHSAQNRSQQRAMLLCLLTPTDRPGHWRPYATDPIHSTARAIM